jgi:hypothetical protein
MDLAVTAFKKVTPVFMYFVPGLSIVEKQMDFARKRWGLEPLQIPHWTMFAAIKYGLYSLPRLKNDAIPKISIKEIYHYVMHVTGAPYIVWGGKAADSVWRKQTMNSQKGYDFLLSPIKNWNKFDVLYYLKTRGIPMPEVENTKNATSGIGLQPGCILWLYDKHREDYEKMAAIFPFIGAVVARRKFYGNQ